MLGSVTEEFDAEAMASVGKQHELLNDNKAEGERKTGGKRLAAAGAWRAYIKG